MSIDFMPSIPRILLPIWWILALLFLLVWFLVFKIPLAFFSFVKWLLTAKDRKKEKEENKEKRGAINE